MEKGPDCTGEVDEGECYALKKIIAGCCKNRSDSQEQLYKMFYGYALAVALEYCYNREDAVEVVNDSFIKVFNSIRSFVASKPFKPWLRRIVINTSIDKIRAKKRFQQHLKIEEEIESISPPVMVESDLTVKQIHGLLHELSDVHRYVFNLYEIEGYSHQEIADKLDIAESSSRTYLTRAKSRLRVLYKKLFAETK